MSSAIRFELDQSKNLSSSNELKRSGLWVIAYALPKGRLLLQHGAVCQGSRNLPVIMYQ